MPLSIAATAAPVASMEGGKKKKAATRRAPSAAKKPTIKDRIKAGAKVRVGEKGALYIVFDGKRHHIKC